MNQQTPIDTANATRASRPRVLIFNDNAKRDLLGIRLLENALRRRGIATAICNPQNAKVKLRQFRPHGLIAARGDHAIARLAAKACKVFIVAGEGGHQTKETMLSVFMGRGYWKLDSVDWIERCYLWSEQTRGWLLETGIFKDAQLQVVGNPRLDIYRDTGLVAGLSKNEGPFRLGVAFSAKSTSTYYGHPRFAKVYHDMHREMTFPITQPGRHYEDVLWRDHAILRNMMSSMRSFLEQTPGEVWLRPSPFESPAEFEFLERLYPGRVKVLPNQTLPEFLCGVDAVLTCWSTVGLEALLLKKPVISIAGLLDQEHLFQHISPRASGFETFVQHYHQPDSEDALLDTLQAASTGALSPSARPEAETVTLLHDLYNWPGEAPACELIAEDIARSLGTSRTQPNAYWKIALPLRYGMPPALASLLVTLRTLQVTVSSGDFKAYWDFLRTSDPAIEKLLRQMSPDAFDGK